MNLHLASYSVCRSHVNTVKCLGIPILPLLFHISKCCTLLKFFVYSKKEFDIFLSFFPLSMIHLIWKFAPLPQTLYLNLLVLLAFHTICTSQVVFEKSQEDLICMRKLHNGAVVCAFVTSHFLGKGTKIGVRNITCLWFRRNVLNTPGTNVVNLMFSELVSSKYILFQVC